jgi:hypothetical protein
VSEGPQSGDDTDASGDRADRGAQSRLCAVTRSERPVDELIRFVAGPDGTMVPDLGRKLPGRGVWITADRATVAAAVSGKAFARSLKRQVEVPSDLADRVEALLLKRLEQALALANKAGCMIFGFAQIDAELERGRVVALVHGAEAAEGGRDKLDRKHAAVARSAGRPAPVIDMLTIQQMSLAMGRANVVHAGLIQGGATDRVVSEAERIKRYRAGFTASD